MKTRFCPSPTGYIHLGNARTALFSALMAWHQQGDFLLRIEDTDQTRSDITFTRALMEDLRWLGLVWQEGADPGGEPGEYYQSQRQPIYDQFYEKLQAQKTAYPCFCTEDQLLLQRKLQQKSGRPPRYAGTCQHLAEADIQEKINAGLKPTLRFRMPTNTTIVFNDLVRGRQRFKSNDLGDFIIRRANGTAPFMYSNAIDDALMGVTHVIRGEDHVANTPRQMTLLKALELPTPCYGHISLIVGPDGSPLSKRHGSRSIRLLREAGFLPQAIVNYLARLGHFYGHDQLCDLSRLSDEFRVAALAKSPAQFTEQQLLFWQSQTIAALTEDQFWQWVGSGIQSKVPENSRSLFFETIRSNIQFPEDVQQWAQILFDELPEWHESHKSIIHDAGHDYFQQAIIALDHQGADIRQILAHLKTTCGVGGKKLFLPLRVALTGLEHGPELSIVFDLMDKKAIKRRLEIGLR